MSSESQPKLLGIGGTLGSGKDTISDYLVDEYGFVKVNMSDPIDQAMRALNPVIGVALAAGAADVSAAKLIRYEDARRAYGFTEAKNIPEFRGVLQRLGVDVGRKLISHSIWIDKARDTIRGHLDKGSSVCLSGVRFVDEQEVIRELDGQLIWVERPGYIRTTGASRLPTRWEGDPVLWAGQAVNTAAHAAEVSLEAGTFDLTITNDSTLDALYKKVQRQLVEVS